VPPKKLSGAAAALARELKDEAEKEAAAEIAARFTEEKCKER
jgi:hypothetical protein